MRRGYALLLLTLAAAAASYVRTALNPLQESMRIALTLTDNQIALLQGPALALPVVLAGVPLGLAIDRYTRVRLLVLLGVCGVVGSLLTAWAVDINVLFFARCLAGLAGAATVTAVFSLLADLFAPAQRGRANMVVGFGQAAGVSAAFALGGMLLAMVGPGAASWRWAMVWLTGPLVLVTVTMLAIREPVRTGLAVANPSVPQAFAEFWRYHGLVGPLMAALVAMEIALGAELTWTAPAFSRAFDLSPQHAGTLIGTALMVSGIAGPLAGGLLADLCQRSSGPRRTMWMVCGLSLLSAPAGLFALMPQVATASVVLAVFATIAISTVVMMTTLFTVVIPNELRGLCLSVAGAACVIFGIGLAPMTVSLLSTALGGPAMIGKALAWVCAAGSVLCTAACALGTRSFPRTA